MSPLRRQRYGKTAFRLCGQVIIFVILRNFRRRIHLRDQWVLTAVAVLAGEVKRIDAEICVDSLLLIKIHVIAITSGQ